MTRHRHNLFLLNSVLETSPLAGYEPKLSSNRRYGCIRCRDWSPRPDPIWISICTTTLSLLRKVDNVLRDTTATDLRQHTTLLSRNNVITLYIDLSIVMRQEMIIQRWIMDLDLQKSCRKENREEPSWHPHRVIGGDDYLHQQIAHKSKDV